MRKRTLGLIALLALGILLPEACGPAGPAVSSPQSTAAASLTPPGTPGVTASAAPPSEEEPARSPTPRAKPSATIGTGPLPSIPAPAESPTSPAAMSLPFSAWSLVTLEGRPVLASTSISLLIEEDALTGRAGCNRYTGSYTAGEEGSLGVTGVALTERFCAEPEGIMDQERAYAEALGRAADYRLAAGRLELLDADGQTLLVFDPQPKE